MISNNPLEWAAARGAHWRQTWAPGRSSGRRGRRHCRWNEGAWPQPARTEAQNKPSWPLHRFWHCWWSRWAFQWEKTTPATDPELRVSAQRKTLLASAPLPPPRSGSSWNIPWTSHRVKCPPSPLPQVETADCPDTAANESPGIYRHCSFGAVLPRG